MRVAAPALLLEPKVERVVVPFAPDQVEEVHVVVVEYKFLLIHHALQLDQFLVPWNSSALV